MKIQCLTCVYKRKLITEAFYIAFEQAVQHAAKAGYELGLTVVASNDADAKLAKHYGHNPVIAPNRPLGRKHNAGLAHMLEKVDFDYMMQLGSDDVLAVSFWQSEALRLNIKQRIPMFGMNQILFFDLNAWDAKRVQVLNPFGAGRFIRRDLLDAAYCKLIEWKGGYSGKGWSAGKGQQQLMPVGKIRSSMHRVLYDDVVVALWEPDRESGLDYNSERRLIQVHGMDVARCRQMHLQDAVLDVKGGQNIHDYNKIHGQRLSAVEVGGLYDEYPVLDWLWRHRSQHGEGRVQSLTLKP